MKSFRRATQRWEKGIADDWISLSNWLLRWRWPESHLLLDCWCIRWSQTISSNNVFFVGILQRRRAFLPRPSHFNSTYSGLRSSIGYSDEHKRHSLHHLSHIWICGFSLQLNDYWVIRLSFSVHLLRHIHMGPPPCRRPNADAPHRQWVELPGKGMLSQGWPSNRWTVAHLRGIWENRQGVFTSDRNLVVLWRRYGSHWLSVYRNSTSKSSQYDHSHTRWCLGSVHTVQ